MAFLQLNIRGRLILGFSVLCVLLAAVVGTTIIKVRTVSEFNRPDDQPSGSDRDDRQ